MLHDEIIMGNANQMLQGSREIASKGDVPDRKHINTVINILNFWGAKYYIYCVEWPSWRPISPTTWLFVQLHLNDKNQRYISMAFCVKKIHRWLVISGFVTKCPVIWKAFSCYNVIILNSQCSTAPQHLARHLPTSPVVPPTIARRQLATSKVAACGSGLSLTLSM